ncbi:MAG: alpha/beta hydrolase [Methanobrevibacter sp.]|uniref:alpha/beta hydrolase fold domain-containing protein n=1 Tax=Methanobrevibacter sp. TaxID=66852 RepID=UPI001B481EC9|nr:alpha/beta hydrolase [Methanobrevibacter sp.]MBP3791752.1 alpha/beta hydrolase [Methanobrevibacter sp.]
MSNQKSFIAKVEEAILKSTKPKYMDIREDINRFLADKLNSNDKPPKGIFKSFDFNGMEVFTIGDENAEKTVLYVHGGAYVNEINYQHLLYCFKLSRKLNVRVFLPVYPLAPSHKVNESLELITEFYETLAHEDKLILMGDSAGGGFILSFCQYIKTIGLPQPSKIITFSPWVDISLGNPPYDSANDPILGEVGLREIGKSWAGDLDTKDYRVSPLYGDNKGLPRTLIFAGTNEIFYKDIKVYVENLKRDGVDVSFIEGNGMFHIYPLFPNPEAKKAFKEIKKEIM